MGDLTILEAIPALIWILNLALVVCLGLVSVFGSFWFRTNINFADKLQKLKWRSEWDNYPSDWLFYFVLCEFFVGGAIAMFISKMIQEGILLPLLSVVGGILLLLYAPRFAIDLIKGLKVNKKGDLGRIDKLEKELQYLKEKSSK